MKCRWVVMWCDSESIDHWTQYETEMAAKKAAINKAYGSGYLVYVAHIKWETELEEPTLLKV